MTTTMLLATLALSTPTGLVGRSDAPTIDKPMQEYISSIQQFGGKFYLAASKKAERNLFVSPVSAHIAFGMLSNGLTGKSLSETSAMLGIDVASLNKQTKDFCARAAADGGKVLSISNGVWNIEPAKLKPGYIKTVQDAFHAEAGSLQWQTGANKVNAWINKNTRQRIPKVLERLSNSDAFVIVNALAFDGEWARKFKAEDTYADTFINNSNNPKVKLMNQTLHCLSGEWKKRPVVELPYKGDYAMLAILPSRAESTNAVLADLAKSGWSQIFKALKEQRTEVWLPKFKIESAINIKELLKGLGAPSLLEFSNDFEPMLGHVPAAVGQALQKVFIQVDEEGTKAAAATVIVGTLGAAMPEQAFEFRANRPFVVALIEKSTGIPIVLGTVFDPTK